MKSEARSFRLPSPDVFAGVTDAYERGQVLEALRRAEAFAPLSHWGGADPCVIAARIASHAGAPGLGLRLSARAWKASRSNVEALVQFGYEIFAWRGPFALWRFLRQWKETGQEAPADLAQVLALRGRAAAELRDFAQAESLQARAEALDPRSAWMFLQRAYLLERQDRVEEALQVAQHSMGLHPHPCYRPAIQACGRFLQLLDRDDEAIVLLREADAVLQNASVSAQLYELLSENERWTEAGAALQRFEVLSPLLEKNGGKWLNAQRARLTARQGLRAQAAQFAARVDDEFHRTFAARLATPAPDPDRVHLDVTFVRQQFKTCAPATLAALGRYWKMPTEHLKLAEAICYDGTPSWQQRRWSQDNGWHVVEFRVTFESAVALLERGIPFAISTVEAASAHMMAVVGFDRTRGTLLLRDPSQPYIVERHVPDFFKRYRAFGPRGTVFVPREERGRLHGLELPDSSLYDHYHCCLSALAAHDRTAAAGAVQALERENAEAELAWQARSELANYDANTAEQLRCVDRLLGLFPANPALLLRRLGCLYEAPREQRVEFLREACAAKDADPALTISLARILTTDARFKPEARRLLRRMMRTRYQDSMVIGALADLLWEEGVLEEATECYRIAANLEGFHEPLYRSWFIACRLTRNTEEALVHLTDRFTRFGARSEQPALTLAWAWKEIEQPLQARTVLDEAMRLRADDGVLKLRAAGVLAALNRFTDALQLLELAKGKVREVDWLRTRMEIAENALDFVAIQHTARELLRREPLALDVHRALARAICAREGSRAALAALKQTCQTFPHHIGLRRLVAEWSWEDGAEAVESATRELLALEPSDAWARRERARALMRLNRAEQALEEAREAARIEPGNSYSLAAVGFACRELGQAAEARAELRRAVIAGVDNGAALTALLELARTDTERREDLALIERELLRQVGTGDGLLTYVDLARPVLEAEALLQVLRQARDTRSDLWHAWVALALQLGHMSRLDEALVAAREAGERFPHLPRVWIELATVHRWRSEAEEEIAAAKRAVQLNPAWSDATRLLANALERRNRLDEALEVYERALGHVPHDAQLHALHATLLWKRQDTDAALAAIERALRIAPANEWAWELLYEWSTQLGDAQRPAEFARTLVAQRAGDPRAWLMLARVLTAPAVHEEKLAAVQRAIALDRRATEAWDLKAELLGLAGRFEEGLQACEEGLTVCPADVHLLQGRRAWLEARRRRYPEAIRLMQAVLAENTSYVWGWQQLSSWHQDVNDLEGAAAAFEQLRRLQPYESWVSRQLGFLRLKQQDRAGARQCFAAALEASPTDANAAYNLFDLQLEEPDLAGAAATVGIMQLHQPGPITLLAQAQLCLRQQNEAQAAQALEKMCALADPDPWPVEAAADAFHNAGRTEAALRVFDRAIRSATCHPQVGAARVRLLIAQRAGLTAVRCFMRLAPGSELQRRAAGPLVNGLAENNRKWLVRWVAWSRQQVVSGDDAAWGAMGFALTRANRMKAVIRWMHDWRQREGVQPWMLFNYCVALRQQGRYAEASEVARHVLSSCEHLDGAADMHLFLALETALAGDAAAAQAHLEQVVVRDNSHFDQQMLALARALVEFQRAPGPVKERFAKARADLATRFDLLSVLRAMRDVRRTFARAGGLFVREGSGPLAWWWFKSRLHWQWLGLPVLAVFARFSPQLVVLLIIVFWTAYRRG